MAEENKVNVIIDIPSTIGPLIAAMLINAQYSALVLKQGSGDNITDDVKRKTLDEII